MPRMQHPFVVPDRIKPNAVDAISEADLRIPDLLCSPYMFQQGLVFTIDQNGYDHRHDQFDEYISLARDRTTKIEGMERFSRKLWNTCNLIANGPKGHMPFSCHLFIANAGAPSFPNHTDPDGVYLYVIAGSKTMHVEGNKYVLNENDTLYIPAGITHRAENIERSIMLSIGFDNFIEEKL